MWILGYFQPFQKVNFLSTENVISMYFRGSKSSKFSRGCTPRPCLGRLTAPLDPPAAFTSLCSDVYRCTLMYCNVLNCPVLSSIYLKNPVFFLYFGHILSCNPVFLWLNVAGTSARFARSTRYARCHQAALNCPPICPPICHQFSKCPPIVLHFGSKMSSKKAKMSSKSPPLSSIFIKII